MRLVGARVAFDANRTERRDLLTAGCAEPLIDLSGYLVLPGLINAHDHLDLNLFPRLVNRIYGNASEWAADIYRPTESPVKEHIAVPKKTRLIWGGIRNLLSGVTTVAHHNPYDAAVFEDNFPVRVLKNTGWAHSLAFSPDLAELFRNSPPEWPFIIHAAEGTDADASLEVSRLNALGVLGPRTVLVHAVGAGTSDVATLRARGCSIVWCPRSNLATCGRTLSYEVLRSGIPIALGTDSALTAEGDLGDEITAAHRDCGLTVEEIYPMVTTSAARILRLEERIDDLIAVIDTGQTPAEALLDLQPQLVTIGGRIKLLSGKLIGQYEGQLHPLHHETRGWQWIDADVAPLLADASGAIGSDIRLAGRRVAA